MYGPDRAGGLLLEGGYRPVEIEKLPKRDSDVQETDAADRATHPA